MNALKITENTEYFKNFATVDISDSESNLEYVALYFDKPKFTLNRMVVRQTDLRTQEQINTFNEAIRIALVIVRVGLGIRDQTPISELNLDVRPYNALKVFGIHTIGDLKMRIATDNFGYIKNLGKVGRNQIMQRLEVYDQVGLAGRITPSLIRDQTNTSKS
jgi:hypothetical protein